MQQISASGSFDPIRMTAAGSGSDPVHQVRGEAFRAVLAAASDRSPVDPDIMLVMMAPTMAPIMAPTMIPTMMAVMASLVAPVVSPPERMGLPTMSPLAGDGFHLTGTFPLTGGASNGESLDLEAFSGKVGAEQPGIKQPPMPPGVRFEQLVQQIQHAGAQMAEASAVLADSMGSEALKSNVFIEGVGQVSLAAAEAAGPKVTSGSAASADGEGPNPESQAGREMLNLVSESASAQRPDDVTSATLVKAPAKPMTDPEGLLHQMSRFVKVMVDGERSELSFQLHPRHLGEVGIRLVVQDGSLRADFSLQDPAVKQMVESQLDQLRNRLIEQGLKVTELHVAMDAGGAQAGFKEFSQQQRRSAFNKGERHWLAVETADALEPGMAGVPKQWLPGSSGRRLNSLV